MSGKTTCPHPSRLAAHAGNGLPRAASVELDRHLVCCRACLDRYVELGRRSLSPDIPHCHIVKEIGRGRFGVVYKAWWLKDDPTIVALKVLTCPGEMERNRFEREIAVLKKLDSPWIVRCRDSGATGDSLYYIMDHVEGGHLDDYLRASAPDMDAKLAVFQRVCRAVADAHRQGVVHRDLKPRNILIDAEGQPHLVDFGICAVETDDWSSWERLTITHPGDVIGTLRYMSPEQAWGGAAGTIDERSDVWSLGIILFEIVTDGDFPYPIQATPDQPVHEALLERIRKELPHIPRLDGIPRGRELEVLLERSLCWDRRRRLASAARLEQDLGRFRCGRRIRTRPLWVPYRLQRLAVGAAMRSRWILSVSLAAAATVAVWLTAFFFGAGWHDQAPEYENGTGAAVGGLSAQPARDGILVVGIGDATVDAVVRFASEQGISGVSAGVRSWRGVHGHVMNRLAEAGPRAVVWDYFFRSQRPGDVAFVSAALSLERRGVPVVLAAKHYGAGGRPDLSPTMTAGLGRSLRHGAIAARDMVHRPGEYVIALQDSTGHAVPGLALAVLGAVLHPEARLELDWPSRDDPIRVLYARPHGGYLRPRDLVTPTKSYRTSAAGHGVQADQLVACNTFALARPGDWMKRTVPYETMLASSDASLHELVAGKIVLVGDLRSPRFGFRGDRHAVKFGAADVRQVPGCFLQADAIAGLLGGRSMQLASPLSPVTFAAVVLAAVLGCLLPIPIARRKGLQNGRLRPVLWGGLVVAAGACFVATVGARAQVTVHLAMAGAAVLTTMTGSFWVEFTRNRHRVGDRRGDAGTAVLSGVGTLTLRPRRRKSIPAAR